MEEYWKPVVGFEGLYEVSSHGKVRSCERPRRDKPFGTLRSRLRKIDASRRYPQVALLNREGAKTTISLHRLVATAFLPNPDNKPCINHKDGNSKNALVENLEWVTYQENLTHAIQTGAAARNGAGNPNAKLCEEQVHQILARLRAGENSFEIAEDFPISPAGVLDIAMNRSWKSIPRERIHPPMTGMDNPMSRVKRQKRLQKTS